MKGDALERYVQQAVRGLYGEKRARVERELRGNLEGRINEFLAFGDSSERAVERALLEFGAAGVVARGMQEVHIMPLAIKSGVGLALTLGVGLTLFSSQAQVLFSTNPPIKTCDTEQGLSLDCKQLKFSWVEPQSFFAALDPGARVRVIPRMSVPVSEAGGGVGGPSVAFGENSSTRDVPGLEVSQAGLKQMFPLWQSQDSFSRDQTFYVDTRVALGGLIKLGVAPRFDRLLNPLIRTAKGQARLGDAAHPVDLSDFVAERVAESLQKGAFEGLRLSANNWRYNSASRVSFYLKGVAQPNASYVLLEWQAMYRISADVKDLPTYRVVTDAVQADARGNLKLVSNQYQLEFAPSLEAFKAKPGLGRALVVKLTGRLDKDLLEPKGVLALPESRGEPWKNYTEER